MAFGLNKEIERRANALIAISDAEGHGTLRIGGGWRSDARAIAEWERRYTPTTQTRRVKATDKKYQGVWYSLNPGEIGVATPGNSYHTTCPPDALTGDTGAVAIDWVNDLVWMQQNCHRVGLKSFQHIPGEGHHTQPVEYPSSRSAFNPKVHKLTYWPIEDLPLHVPITLAQATAYVLKKGSGGDNAPLDEQEAVVWLQWELTQHGFPTKDDGDFGPKTDASVRKFQKQAKIKVDGLVGSQTWGKLVP